MPEPTCNQKFLRTINIQEFNQLLENSVMNNEQKNMVCSIFEYISGDGELDEGEWNKFIGEIDSNRNGELTKKEFNSALTNNSKNRTKIAYYLNRNLGITKDAIKTFYHMVKKYIETKFSPKLEGEDGSRYAFCGADNNREDPINEGSFDGNWLLYDAYGSETYDDWLENNGYEVNQALGNRLYKNVAHYDYRAGEGQCAKSVREGMQSTTAVGPAALIFSIVDYDDYQNLNNEQRKKALKLLDTFKNGNPIYAYQYGEVLSMNPYFKELPHNIIESTDLDDLINRLPKGCVVVYDAGYIDGHDKGHIAVKDEKGWDSGGGRYDMIKEMKKKATHVRIFIPIIDKKSNGIPTLPMRNGFSN